MSHNSDAPFYSFEGVFTILKKENTMFKVFPWIILFPNDTLKGFTFYKSRYQRRTFNFSELIECFFSSNFLSKWVRFRKHSIGIVRDKFLKFSSQSWLDILICMYKVQFSSGSFLAEMLKRII